MGQLTRIWYLGQNFFISWFTGLFFADLELGGGEGGTMKNK